jgi:hypothetical protein
MTDAVTDAVKVDQDLGSIVQPARSRDSQSNNSNVLHKTIPAFPHGLISICGATATGKSGLTLGKFIVSLILVAPR